MNNEKLLYYYLRRINELKDVLGVRNKNIFDYVIDKHKSESSYTEEGLPPIGGMCEVLVDESWVLGKCVHRESPKWSNPFCIVLLDGYDNKVVRSYPHEVRDVEIEEHLFKIEITKIIELNMKSGSIWPTVEQRIANQLWRIGYRNQSSNEEQHEC